VGGHVEVLDTKARMAECLCLAGDVDAALHAVDEAIEQSRGLGGVSAQHPLLYRIRGAVLVRRGDLDGARDALEESLRAGVARDADYEQALTLRVLARLDDRSGNNSYPGAQAESAAILDRLGVVWTPDLV
jgi:predicted negative regulator of RcsB-dependent stress response